MTGTIGDRWVVYVVLLNGWEGWLYMDSFGYQNDERVTGDDLRRLEEKPLPVSVLKDHVARQ